MNEHAFTIVRTVRFYGCVRCQVHHFEDTDSRRWLDHMLYQDKNGTQYTRETVEDRGRRYGIPYYLERRVWE